MTEVKVQDLYASFINDADFNSDKTDEEREHLAQIEAKNRVRQHQNNEKALAMANQKSSLELLNEYLGIEKQISGTVPPRPGLVWNPRTHRWIRPEFNKYKDAMNRYENNVRAAEEKAKQLQDAKKLYYTGKIKTNEYAKLMQEYNRIVDEKNRAKKDIDVYKGIIANRK